MERFIGMVSKVGTFYSLYILLIFLAVQGFLFSKDNDCKDSTVWVKSVRLEGNICIKYDLGYNDLFDNCIWIRGIDSDKLHAIGSA